MPSLSKMTEYNWSGKPVSRVTARNTVAKTMDSLIYEKSHCRLVLRIWIVYTLCGKNVLLCLLPETTARNRTRKSSILERGSRERGEFLPDFLDGLRYSRISDKVLLSK